MVPAKRETREPEKSLDPATALCKAVSFLPVSCIRKDKFVNFAVIALPRSGSTHFTHLLHQQDTIVCQGEVFHPKKIFLRWPKKDKSPEALASLAELRRRDPKMFLDHILSRTYGATHVGFKIFPGHNDEILKQLIESEGIKKIVLLRSNFLASYSSRLIRHQTRSRDTANAKPQAVHFDPEKFLSFSDKAADFFRALFERLTAAGSQFHLVHYEEVNDPWFFARTLTFIGVHAAVGKMEMTRKKQNASDILSRFANPADVREFLSVRGLMHWQYENTISLDPFGSVDEHRRSLSSEIVTASSDLEVT